MNYWVGISRPSDVEPFELLNGLPLPYANWEITYPVSVADKNCVYVGYTLGTGLLWKNEACASVGPYLCQLGTFGLFTCIPFMDE